jgi:hypothetical protein
MGTLRALRSNRAFGAARENILDQPSAEALQALIDKQAIGEVLAGYCRAIDRRDANLLRSVYWEDAVDDHAVFAGNVEEFIAYSFPFMEGVITHHTISNILVDITGPDEAFSECYFSAFHDFPAEGGRLERTVGGRYLDLHERRGREWRIKNRTLVIDWYAERPGTSVWDAGRYANLPNRGVSGPDDPLYRLHPRLPTATHPARRDAR